MNVLPLTIESMVALLLLATILYCVRLNSQLKRLKADESSMKNIIGELLTGIENAERAISGLRATVREADESLAGRLRDAERFCKQIKVGTEAATEVLSRLGQVSGARPWLLGVDVAEEPRDLDEKPAPTDPMSIVAAAQALAERAQARAKAIAA
jgi:chromosome segregation ATPase